MGEHVTAAPAAGGRSRAASWRPRGPSFWSTVAVIELVADWGRGHDGGAHAGQTTGDAHAASGIPHVPHLLDFHDLRRPECLAFWGAMAACFGFGFVPRRQHAEAA